MSNTVQLSSLTKIDRSHTAIQMSPKPDTKTHQNSKLVAKYKSLQLETSCTHSRYKIRKPQNKHLIIACQNLINP